MLTSGSVPCAAAASGAAFASPSPEGAAALAAAGALFDTEMGMDFDSRLALNALARRRPKVDPTTATRLDIFRALSISRLLPLARGLCPPRHEMRFGLMRRCCWRCSHDPMPSCSLISFCQPVPSPEVPLDYVRRTGKEAPAGAGRRPAPEAPASYRARARLTKADSRRCGIFAMAPSQSSI